MQHHHSIFALAFIALLSLVVVSAQNATTTGGTTSGQAIGDFQFISPKGNKELYKVGSAVNIEWKTIPDSIPKPPTISIQARYGAWPDVSPWINVAENIENTGTFEWLIPENAFPDKKYILKLSTPKTDKVWIREKVSDFFFQVYVGTPVVDGVVYWNSAESLKVVTSLIFSLAFAVFVL